MRVRRTWAVGVFAFALTAGRGTKARAAPPPEPEAARAQAPRFEYEGPPRDPDDTPFMDAPRNQLPRWSARERPVTPSYSEVRRIQVTLMPTYAAFRLPFIGRPNVPVRGFGASIELDVRLLRWLSARAHFSHTVHPVPRQTRFDEEDEELILDANRGLVQATNGGLSLVYPLDLGRMIPWLDVGVGAFFMGYPDPARRGQVGAECRDEGVCDPGLVCQADNVCRASLLFEVHAGLGLDILLREHWSIGGSVRYFALLTDPAAFPVYLMATFRIAARF